MNHGWTSSHRGHWFSREDDDLVPLGKGEPPLFDRPPTPGAPVPKKLRLPKITLSQEDKAALHQAVHRSIANFRSGTAEHATPAAVPSSPQASTRLRRGDSLRVSKMPLSGSPCSKSRNLNSTGSLSVPPEGGNTPTRKNSHTPEPPPLFTGRRKSHSSSDGSGSLPSPPSPSPGSEGSRLRSGSFLGLNLNRMPVVTIPSLRGGSQSSLHEESDTDGVRDRFSSKGSDSGNLKGLDGPPEDAEIEDLELVTTPVASVAGSERPCHVASPRRVSNAGFAPVVPTVITWRVSAELISVAGDTLPLTQPQPTAASCWGCFAKLRRRLAGPCKTICRSRALQIMVVACLLVALLLPDIWVIAQVPHDRDLDVAISCVFIVFSFEIVVQSFGETRTYLLTTQFWMDILGTVTLLFDLSYVPLRPSEDVTSSNVLIIRLAKLAKVATRAGRLSRLVKLVRLLPVMGLSRGTKASEPCKVLSSRLMKALSERISCLMVSMVCCVSFISMFVHYQDSSIEAWLLALEETAISHPESFALHLAEFRAFYEQHGYRPFLLRARNHSALPAAARASLPWRSSLRPPRREASLRSSRSSHLEVDIDYQESMMLDSFMNLSSLFLIMLLLVIFSLLLSNSVGRLVLRPLEKLLGKVQQLASTIANSVRDMASTTQDNENLDQAESGDEEEDVGNFLFGRETQLLERVLLILSELKTKNDLEVNEVNAEATAGLDEGDRAVVYGYQGQGSMVDIWVSEASCAREEMDRAEMLEAQKTMLETAGLSLELINSYDLNPLVLDKARCHAAAVYFVGQHHHGVSHDPVTMRFFLEAAEAGYNRSPYHNWFHAVDVTHFVLRLFQTCSAEAYFSSLERYSLLVAAICHDIGHPGFNNPFLTETGHDMALRYNDRSPLENMHAARLFEIAAMPKTNIFAEVTQFKELRKVIVDAILHTDNAQHFVMVKDMEMLCEMHSDALYAIGEDYEADSAIFPSPTVTEFYRKSDVRHMLLSMWLHLADLSNTMKPFRVCRIWAWKVLEELFSQGDQEKQLGVPVQALNDRDKVNRPFSQVGFIEFLVSPLLVCVVRVLPPTVGYSTQLYSNAKSWQQCWVDETLPTPSETEQRVVSERLTKLGQRLLMLPS